MLTKDDLQELLTRLHSAGLRTTTAGSTTVWKQEMLVNSQEIGASCTEMSIACLYGNFYFTLEL